MPRSLKRAAKDILYEFAVSAAATILICGAALLFFG